MRAALALGFVLWAGFCFSAQAGSAGISCVKSQLHGLGYYDGPVNGTLGADLVPAANAWRRERILPELTSSTAMTWCRRIGMLEPALKRHWPSEGPVQVYSPSIEGAAALREGDAVARAFFKDTYGIELATPVAVVGSNQLDELDGLVAQALRAQGRGHRARPLPIDRFCREGQIGGAANRGYVVFCWPGADATAAWRALTQADLHAVMVHEYAHQVQYALASDAPARKADGNWALRPHWFVEGMAELIEWQFVTGAQLVDGPELFDLQTPARRSRATLVTLTPEGAVKDTQTYGVARFAVYLLVQRNGIDALFDYLLALGRRENPEDAFAATFELTPDAYAEVFEGLRRDYGAARRFGRGE